MGRLSVRYQKNYQILKKMERLAGALHPAMVENKLVGKRISKLHFDIKKLLGDF